MSELDSTKLNLLEIGLSNIETKYEYVRFCIFVCNLLFAFTFVVEIWI